MLRAMYLESRCNPDAVGDDYPINGLHAVSCGLLQVRALEPWRGTCEQLKNPEFNVKIAYKVWKQQGYRAWTSLHKKG